MKTWINFLAFAELGFVFLTFEIFDAKEKKIKFVWKCFMSLKTRFLTVVFLFLPDSQTLRTKNLEIF